MEGFTQKELSDRARFFVLDTFATAASLLATMPGSLNFNGDFNREHRIVRDLQNLSDFRDTTLKTSASGENLTIIIGCFENDDQMVLAYILEHIKARNELMGGRNQDIFKAWQKHVAQGASQLFWAAYRNYVNLTALGTEVADRANKRVIKIFDDYLLDPDKKFIYGLFILDTLEPLLKKKFTEPFLSQLELPKIFNKTFEGNGTLAQNLQEVMLTQFPQNHAYFLEIINKKYLQNNCTEDYSSFCETDRMEIFLIRFRGYSEYLQRFPEAAAQEADMPGVPVLLPPQVQPEAQPQQDPELFLGLQPVPPAQASQEVPRALALPLQPQVQPEAQQRNSGDDWKKNCALSAFIMVAGGATSYCGFALGYLIVVVGVILLATALYKAAQPEPINSINNPL